MFHWEGERGSNRNMAMYQILVIDDEKFVLDFLEKALTRYGYQVKAALGGREGLRYFENDVFDLVITDVVMPDINGSTVAHHIRRSSRPKTPIISMSGTPWLSEGDEFDVCLQKPFGLHDLLEAVASVITIEVARDAAS